MFSMRQCPRSLLLPAFAAMFLLGPASAQVPLLTERTRLEASGGGPGDEFGSSLSLDGDTLAVGAALAGCGYGCGVVGLEEAYVFERDGSGWSESQRLDALDTSDGASGNGFGALVALDGDTLVVGAPFQDSLSGAAYVFVRAGGTWTEQAKIAGFGFLTSLALDGDTLLISCGLRVDFRVHVFVRDGATWTEQARLEDLTSVELGQAIAIEGDTAVVGAPVFDCSHLCLWDPGYAQVFVRDGSRWREEATLVASDYVQLQDEHFGSSVSIDGDTLLVGALGYDFDRGAAYVFTRQGTTWREHAKLVASDALGFDGLGSSVALDGDVALVGTSGHVNASVYAFVREGPTWSQRAKLVASSGGWNESFGSSLALEGCTAMVGASSGLEGGSAYVYAVRPAGARFRNAGVNPPSYAASSPMLGGAFTATVDLAASGHNVAVLFGFEAPASIALPGGQVLLCRSSGAGRELLGRPAAVGPKATFRFEIPDDLALCGLSLSTQAALFGVGVPFALSNAQDLVVGTF